MRGACGKETFWVADIEELENLDSSEIHARRLNAKVILKPKNGETIRLPIADGTVELSGGDQGTRKSIRRRNQLVRSEELSGGLRGNSDVSQRKDETMNDNCRSIEGNYIYRDDVEPSFQLHVPKE